MHFILLNKIVRYFLKAILAEYIWQIMTMMEVIVL